MELPSPINGRLMSLDTENQKFWDAADLEGELKRVTGVCNGCRRCYNLCPSECHEIFAYVEATVKVSSTRALFGLRARSPISCRAICAPRISDINPAISCISFPTRMFEKCAAIDGTRGLKEEYFDLSSKVAAPLLNRIRETAPDLVVSDCSSAGLQIQQGTRVKPLHPIQGLERAYGLDGNDRP
jgi:Fe-S oxidoreductase